MIQTQNIHSLTDFQRNTASHLRALRKSGLPEVLTVKGKAELVVQTAEAYQALLSRLELYESAIAINRGLQDIEEGRSSTLDDFDRRMRSKAGFSPRKD
ncbi:type II toxin-antitoxin system Phd/YefM family antitoxin [Phragmitibacter flavus]|uniref:Type II toxin-antitoxin system Phd/YefM family antitoxin n=1 Tax=Phragmitibacter flavus TaxID=2576071 RepID=A0A5R8KGM6_9BACT|nr:type II toxin-antitoxin system Phd/YefM family antitoxin [Phragmitibacter flavus]TLD71463.1 type II toxin-antitoxin system Phd/YefM family antitoxin [Phragmitibacter flavus]